MRRRALLFQSGETDYSKQYLTIVSLADNNTIGWKSSKSSLTKTIYISTDNGRTWTEKTSSTDGTVLAVLNNNDRLLVKQYGSTAAYGDSSNDNSFTSTQDFEVEGNIMSLVSSDFTTASSVGNYALKNLFQNCSMLKSVKNLVLPATTLGTYCYSYMFNNCTSLTTAPLVLPAPNLMASCYRGMFNGCTSLTVAPEISATTLAGSCCYCMFQNCTSLTKAPDLLATVVYSSCYYQMFYNCSSLSYIKCNAQAKNPSTSTLSGCFTNWAHGVSTDGRFYFNSKLYWITGDSGMPVSWDTYPIEDATQDYLTFIAGSSGTYTFTIPETVTTTQLTSISYSLDGGATWTTTNNSSSSVTVTTPTVSEYSRVLWKGSGNTLYKDVNNYCKFSATMNFCVAGNIMSLLYSNFKTRKTLSYTYCFFKLFENNTKLVNAAGLMLPATSLSTSCYSNMFNGCTYLTHSPVLPAKTLSNSCYGGLFNGCTRLAYIKAMFTTTPGNTYTQNWVNNVASSGTFVKNSAATWTNVFGGSEIPSGWTVRTASS